MKQILISLSFLSVCLVSGQSTQATFSTQIQPPTAPADGSFMSTHYDSSTNEMGISSSGSRFLPLLLLHPSALTSSGLQTDLWALIALGTAVSGPVCHSPPFPSCQLVMA